MGKKHLILQHDEKDCGAACLAMVAWYYGLKLPLVRCRQLIQVDQNGASLYGVCKGAEMIGLNAVPMEGTYQELIDEIKNGTVRYPLIARIISAEGYEHFIIVDDIGPKSVSARDPGHGRMKYPVELFRNIWTGHLISLYPGESFRKGNENRGIMKKYLRLITSQKKMIAGVTAISLLISTVSLLGSTVFETIVNSLIRTDRVPVSSAAALIGTVFSNLNILCISVLLLYLFQGILSVLRSRMLARLSRNMDQTLTLEFFRHLIRLPLGFFQGRKSGEILSRFSDASEIRDAMSGSVLTLLIDSVMAVFFGAYLCSISVPLFLIAALMMAAYAAVVFCFRSPIHGVNMNAMENTALMTSHLKESIEGVEMIKAYGLEDKSSGKARSLFERMADNFMKGTLIYSVKDALISFIASAGVLTILWGGNRLCVNGTIGIGSMISFYIVLGYFLDPVKNLIELQPMIQTAAAAAERLNDVLELPTEAVSERKDGSLHLSLRGDVEFHDVTFRYGYRDAVIDRLSCRIRQGTRVAVIGESGSGKTTLMKLLSAFIRPESGSITVGGQDLRDSSPDEIRARIAWVQQNPFFFSDTIRNNLTMGSNSVSDDTLKETLRKVQADEFVGHLPMGLDTVLSENASDLSGGQRQRLALARALLRRPDIIILDEATSNLDTITENSVKESIFRETEGVTTFIIAHRLSTVRGCDLILVMDHGRIAESGTHDELLAAGGRYAAFWKNHF